MMGLNSPTREKAVQHTFESPIWQCPWPEKLPELNQDVEADVCVIGLGGSGLSCIAEVLELGSTVVGIDAGRVGGAAAGRNGGFLLAGTAAFYHDATRLLGRERARVIYQLTLRQIDRIASEAPESVRRVGSLRIAASPEEARDCAVQLETMLADGLPVEEYSGVEGDGLLFPQDAAFDPLLRCRILASKASQVGARLFESTPAISFDPGTVRTPSASIRCRTVIVAADGRLAQLFPELSGRVRTARLQMLATAPLAETRFTRPVYHRWGYEYWQQLPNGSLALGGFRDQCEDDEWTDSPESGECVQRLLEHFLRQHLGIDAEITHRWAACVGYATGPLPILEEVRRGVWAVGGYSGTGNVLGALCGRAAAQLVVRGESELALVADRISSVAAPSGAR